MANITFYQRLQSECLLKEVSLIAVSKTKPLAEIMELYEAGQRIFGENRVQELTEKYEQLPKDIQWHLIGHLQSNKVKYIASFVSMIHSIDSLKLLEAVNKQAAKNDRIIDCLLQFYIAKEDTKFGLDWTEALDLLAAPEFAALHHVRMVGVMGMASFTEDENQIRSEFQALKSIFDRLKSAHFSDKPYFKEISMGMSGDYEIAIEAGSTMIRVGSLLFDAR